MRRTLIGTFGLIAMLATSAAQAQQAPPEPAPDAAPPPPSAVAPPPTSDEGAPPPVNIAAPTINVTVAPQGQWVYTSQYGWIWMPYAQNYTYAPTEAGGDPFMYVYYPAWGWRWVAAPWIFGIGPRPWFGTVGYSYYGWYGHPWFGHTWYGFHRGYPGGYHGIVYSHPRHYRWGGGATHVVVRSAPTPRPVVVHNVVRAQPAHVATPGNVAHPAGTVKNVAHAAPAKNWAHPGGGGGGGHHGGGHRR